MKQKRIPLYWSARRAVLNVWLTQVESMRKNINVHHTHEREAIGRLIADDKNRENSFVSAAEQKMCDCFDCEQRVKTKKEIDTKSLLLLRKRLRYLRASHFLSRKRKREMNR